MSNSESLAISAFYWVEARQFQINNDHVRWLVIQRRRWVRCTQHNTRMEEMWIKKWCRYANKYIEWTEIDDDSITYVQTGYK